MVRFPTLFFVALASFLGTVSMSACGGSDSSGGGAACTDTALPAATTDCKIAGSYQFQTSPRCPNTCDVEPSSFGPVVVTTDGKTATAKFQNTGSDGARQIFELRCTLKGCDCTGQSHFVFTRDGLVGEGSSTAGSCSYMERFTAVRQ